MDKVADGLLYVGGSFCAAESGRTAPVFEKATGAQIGTYALGTAVDVDRAVRAARDAQPAWAALAGAARAA